MGMRLCRIPPFFASLIWRQAPDHGGFGELRQIFFFLNLLYLLKKFTSPPLMLMMTEKYPLKNNIWKSGENDRILLGKAAEIS